MGRRLILPALMVVTLAVSAAPAVVLAAPSSNPPPTNPQPGDMSLVMGPGPNDFYDPSTGLQYWGDTDTYENLTTGSVFVYDEEADLYVDEAIKLYLDVRSPHLTYRDADTGRNCSYDAERGRYLADFNIEFDPVHNTYVDPNTRHTLTFDDEATYLDEFLQLEFEPPSLYVHRPTGYKFEYYALADVELQGRNVELDMDPDTGSFVDPVSHRELVYEPETSVFRDPENGLEYAPEDGVYWDPVAQRSLWYDTYDEVYRDGSGVAFDPVTIEPIAPAVTPSDDGQVVAATAEPFGPDGAAVTPAAVTPDTVAARSPTAAGAVATGRVGELPDDGPTGIRAWQWLLVAIAGAVLAMLLALLVVARRRRIGQPAPSGRPGFSDLIDVSRRLATADSTVEVEQMAVRQAMWLTSADAGAFIRRGDRELEVGFETSPGLLVRDRLRDGALDRVVSAGHDLAQVSSTEPAIRHVPVSLLAIPILTGGNVRGAIVLLRPAETPFVDHERRTATDLKSIVGAALEHVDQNERTRTEAYVDTVTGVQNRRALDLRVDALGGASFAAMMVDLDHFKMVNDTYGHQAGDELLHAVARRIEAGVRSGDDVYRYGGEEFAIVMPGTDGDTAVATAERVRASLADSPFTIGDDHTRQTVTASIGVAVGNAGSAVFGKADEALYRAKADGRNRVVLSELAAWGPPD